MDLLDIEVDNAKKFYNDNMYEHHIFIISVVFK